MFHKIKNNEKGFTIIEVLIVLAIAGLIMLVVFLAVPALQRNSRNSQRKGDVQAILGGVSEFSGNNNGKIPATAAEQATVLASVKLGYYDTIAWGTGVQTALTTDTVRVVTVAKCGASGATVAGSARQIAIQYQNEGSGGNVGVCQDA